MFMCSTCVRMRDSYIGIMHTRTLWCWSLAAAAADEQGDAGHDDVQLRLLLLRRAPQLLELLLLLWTQLLRLLPHGHGWPGRTEARVYRRLISCKYHAASAAITYRRGSEG